MHCSTGPAILYDDAALPTGCNVTANSSHQIPVDFDGDGDVDQDDFGVFQRCYSGAGNPADPACAN